MKFIIRKYQEKAEKHVYVNDAEKRQIEEEIEYFKDDM